MLDCGQARQASAQLLLVLACAASASDWEVSVGELPSPHARSRAELPARLAPADSSMGGDEFWSSEFPCIGSAGPPEDLLLTVVHSLAVYQDRLVVGGGIGFMDGIPVHNVALWDGTRWTDGAADADIPFGNCLYSSGDTLVVGTHPLGEREETIVNLWDGVKWTSFGHGLVHRVGPWVSKVVRYRGDLVVAGRFQYAGGELTPGVARWDGRAWHAMGSDSLHAEPTESRDSVEDLIVFRGELFAQGWMRFNDGDPAVSLARWSGDRWVPMEDQPDGQIRAMAVYQDQLILGGWFDRIGSTPTNGLAAWDGESWRELGWQEDSGVTRRVHALFAAGDSLIVAEDRIRDGRLQWTRLNVLRGGQWHAIGLDAFGPRSIRCFAAYHGRIIVGGGFGMAEPRWKSSNIAAWDGRRWGPLGEDRVRLTGSAVGLTSTPRGLFAAGGFVAPEVDTAMITVGIRSVGQWSLLGGAFNDEIRTLLLVGDDIYVGGDFTSVDGQPVERVARYDGETRSWYPLGDGVSWWARTMVWFEDRLIVGGSFRFAGGQEVGGVAAWNGVSWEPLGAGFDATVVDLQVYRGDLIALGIFHYSGSETCGAAARWDGERWIGFADGFAWSERWGPAMYRGIIWNDRLVAAGDFSAVNGVETGNLASWDGALWSPILPAYEGAPWRLGLYEGRLVVGGDYYRADGYPGLMQYDGERWWTMGSGFWSGSLYGQLGEEITSIAEHEGDLYASGDALEAGGRPSAWIARWTGSALHLPPPAAALRIHPNPLRDAAVLCWTQPEGGPVSVDLYDVQGRIVNSMLEGSETDGVHAVDWLPLDANGKRLPAGVYFARLMAGRATAGARVVLLR